ncbi:hypothetical protein [Gimesia aquarii]|uniref:Uncharacterized protein n=1 Tax=Gimesia aquarii TaxID=2527964 RepID=A0A517VXR2_9PLAN|nr:hypothetical protein [Gimesia aquarii]QDT97789.1 hypothetical protein V144x_32710 [Gimesia aquarii]
MLRHSILFLSLVCCSSRLIASEYFQIRVIDVETERGIPLVELETVNQIKYVTDSNGIAAINEPGLMNQDVYFHIRSHGYVYPKDGFGLIGKKLEVKPGGQAVLQMKRINLAQRLYRVTGGGIYRDSLLVGEPVPLKEPTLNGRVLGSDSVVNSVFKNRIYWFWGDTNRVDYPLGNFHVPGAVSKLPTQGGLDINQGVNLNYFLNENGFAKKTCEMPGAGPTWIDALVTLKDESGEERLFAKYVKVKPPLTVYERGLVEFNDELKQFEKQKVFDFDAPLYPIGHPVLHRMEGVDYVLFGLAFPLIRVRATPEALEDLSVYETYTYLKPGKKKEEWAVDRDKQGQLQYMWRKKMPPLSNELEQKLVKQNKISASEGFCNLFDIETKQKIEILNSSVAWNAYRNKWTMIALQKNGTSMLGEIWYSEAESPLGPCKWARKIVTHDKYSFYNPKQHSIFAQDNGRFIYFEGTYTTLFSGNPVKTPRYDYNQIMYKLDLSDPRLAPELFQQ